MELTETLHVESCLELKINDNLDFEVFSMQSIIFYQNLIFMSYFFPQCIRPAVFGS